MFKRLDHVEIVTDKLDRTIEFYTEVLGFEIKLRERFERSPIGVPMDLAYLELGGAAVELMSYEGGSVEAAQEKEHLGYRLVAIEVEDMAKAAEHLKTKGVEIVWGPRAGPRYIRAEICDPNGFHIELRQWLQR
jgi:catechol 2,3-dioxygenase-like lactoylglutathione lyase family enzyme